MQTMYSVVAKALEDMQMKAKPEDYLNFYCLGNREELPDALNNSGETVYTGEIIPLVLC